MVSGLDFWHFYLEVQDQLQFLQIAAYCIEGTYHIRRFEFYAAAHLVCKRNMLYTLDAIVPGVSAAWVPGLRSLGADDFVCLCLRVIPAGTR